MERQVGKAVGGGGGGGGPAECARPSKGLLALICLFCLLKLPVHTAQPQGLAGLSFCIPTMFNRSAHSAGPGRGKHEVGEGTRGEVRTKREGGGELEEVHMRYVGLVMWDHSLEARMP